MASFALESCSRLHIRLHTIILSYGLGQDEEDPSPLTVITIKTARTLAWKNKRILKKLEVNVKPSLRESAPLVSNVWLYTATEVMKKVMFTFRNIFMLRALTNQLTSGLH